MGAVDEGKIYRLKAELADLDREWVEIKGRKFKPSQCYRVEYDPVHFLFNTNCPDTLKKRIQTMLKKYLS